MSQTTVTINLADDPLPTENVSRGGRVLFHNNTGSAVTITFDNPGLFNPSPGNSINIPANCDEALTVGNTQGVENYNVSEGAAAGGRPGRINVN